MPGAQRDGTEQHGRLGPPRARRLLLPRGRPARRAPDPGGDGLRERDLVGCPGRRPGAGQEAGGEAGGSEPAGPGRIHRPGSSSYPGPQGRGGSAGGCGQGHYASRNGHSAVCQFLLQSGAQCNAQTHGGATALHRASYGGHLDVARLLLAQGADPTITDDEDMTSLHKAAEKGHLELCELLLQHSPGLKGLRDRKARRACDLVPSSGALRDLLETARP